MNLLNHARTAASEPVQTSKALSNSAMKTAAGNLTFHAGVCVPSRRCVIAITQPFFLLPGKEVIVASGSPNVGKTRCFRVF